MIIFGESGRNDSEGPYGPIPQINTVFPLTNKNSAIFTLFICGDIIVPGFNHTIDLKGNKL